MLTTALFSLAVSASPGAAQSPAPSPTGASQASAAPCPALPDLPNDFATAFAYDLRPPAILRFITALDALPARDQKRVFDEAVAAASSPGEAAAKSAIAATCPDLDEIYGQSRALYLVSNEWTLRELANAKRFSAFADVVDAAVSALKLGDALDPALRQAALAPFADLPGLAAPSPAPEAAANEPCAQADAPAHTVHLVTVSYPPVAAAAATSGTIKVKVHLDSFGYVRDASVFDSTAPARIGSDDLVRESILAAAATTYAPAIKACKQVAGTYLFRADFTRR